MGWRGDMCFFTRVSEDFAMLHSEVLNQPENRLKYAEAIFNLSDHLIPGKPVGLSDSFFFFYHFCL